jgi:hypothetical protein
VPALRPLIMLIAIETISRSADRREDDPCSTERHDLMHEVAGDR